MSDWIKNIQEAVSYIEDNLERELDIEEMAAKACLSSFYFQRIFGAMCGW